MLEVTEEETEKNAEHAEDIIEIEDEIEGGNANANEVIMVN